MFDREGRSADWNNFNASLWAHLDLHVVLFRQEHTHYQHSSLFADCNREVLLIPGTPKGPRCEGNNRHVPNSRLFSEPVPLDPFDVTDHEAAMDSTLDEETQPTDALLHVQLAAYVPKFIWAFNCLKHAILEDDEHLKDLEVKYAKQHTTMEELHGVPVPPRTPIHLSDPVPDIASDFLLGMAADSWRSEGWKEFFVLAQSKAIAQQNHDAGIRTGDGGRVPHPDTNKCVKLNTNPRADGLASFAPMSEPDSSMKKGELHLEFSLSVADIFTRASSATEKHSDMVTKAPAVGPANLSREANLILIKNCSDGMTDLGLKLYWAKKYRASHVRRFNSTMKCLAILLNTKLLNFAIYGKSLSRNVVNYFPHMHKKYCTIVQDALNNVELLINQYKADRAAIRENKCQQRIAEESVAINKWDEDHSSKHWKHFTIFGIRKTLKRF